MILKGLGVDPHDHNFERTPQRVADVYEELFDPPNTGWPVFDEQFTDMIVMRNHVFYTMCPHHLLPVEIRADVAYVPNGKVIGASKLIRMIHDANRFPMTQEALTYAIQKRIWELTNKTAQGEAVLLRGRHGCFSMRGVRSHTANMVTVKYGGKFADDGELRQRFEWLVRLA